MPLEARVTTDYKLNPSMALLLGFEPRQHYERALANAMSCFPVHCICSPSIKASIISECFIKIIILEIFV